MNMRQWCTTFGGLCEYVPCGAQLLQASANMCQVMHNFGDLCAFVPNNVSQPVNFTNVNYVKLLICITVMMRFEIPHPLC